MTNATFSFETSPNTNPSLRENCGGTRHITVCPRLKKWGGHAPVSSNKLRPWWQNLTRHLLFYMLFSGTSG